MATAIIDGVSQIAPVMSVNVLGNGGIDYDRMAGALTGALSGIEITAIFEVDGRVLAKTTAPLINKEINSLNTRDGRRRGDV